TGNNMRLNLMAFGTWPLSLRARSHETMPNFWWKACGDIINKLPVERWEQLALDAMKRLRDATSPLQAGHAGPVRGGGTTVCSLAIGRPGFDVPAGMRLHAIPVVDPGDDSAGIFFQLLPLTPTHDGNHRTKGG